MDPTKMQGPATSNPQELDSLLGDILVDANNEDEQLWSFRQVIEDEVPLPADAYVIGEPVSVLGIDYDGNERRGLVARCRREDGAEHFVAAADVAFPVGTAGALYIECYRKWLGLDPLPRPGTSSGTSIRRPKAQDHDLDAAVGGRIDLVVLRIGESSARCRILGTERELTLRARVGRPVPGEILTVKVRKHWRFAKHPYVSGDIESSRLDVAALGLEPLRLENTRMWEPDEVFWEEGWEELDELVGPAIAGSGPRPAYEMEQVRPGADPEDAFNDPIVHASEMRQAGDVGGAWELLMELLAVDLRCLDAHAHLGNVDFDHRPQDAIRHYAMGVRIGELSLAEDFDGLLPWAYLDNRPFLRCLHGYGLCLWRLGRSEEAAAVFERMLWLNPNDDQGARFLLAGVRAGHSWESLEDR